MISKKRHAKEIDKGTNKGCDKMSSAFGKSGFGEGPGGGFGPSG